MGPSDLLLDVGDHNRLTDPAFITTLDKIVDSSREYDVAPSMHCTTRPGPTDVNEAIERGFRFCAVDSDTAFLRTAASRALRNMKGWKRVEESEQPRL